MGPQEAEQVRITQEVMSFWDESTMGPIKYPNEDIVQSVDDIRTVVEITHPTEGRKRESIGQQARIHSLGFLTFVCHLPMGLGKLKALRISDAVSARMDNAHLYTATSDLIVFRESWTSELGEKQGTYRVTIVVPFRRQEIK